MEKKKRNESIVERVGEAVRRLLDEGHEPLRVCGCHPELCVKKSLPQEEGSRK